ncbi:MAG: hypothetical protein K2L67_03430 [Clostridia bacterium]|nr:hypothetical protein [Clostridia bacterium]
MIVYRKYFEIIDYPDDVYKAVGKIIATSQKWEQRFKVLANMLEIPFKKIGNASLNKLNEALKKEKRISEKDFKNLKEVIKIRNYINHEFFLKDFEIKHDSFEQKLEFLETKLNTAQFFIFEATDVIENKIDELQGKNILRPTAFD